MVLIIAEIGVNHNGNMDTAYKLIDMAALCNADIVKFQLFDPARLDPAGDRRDMLKRVALSQHQHALLNGFAATRNIEFLSTLFDVDSLAFLVGLGVKRIKIASGNLDNDALLRAASNAGLPILLSTGIATPRKIMGALEHIDREMWPLVTLMHCTSAYPCPDEDVNLRAMSALWDAPGYNFGFSDHSEGIMAALGAVAMGASVIEKHLTLDRHCIGPDHSTSSEPHEFLDMVSMIRRLERQLGDGVKRVMPSEAAAVAIARERADWRKCAV